VTTEDAPVIELVAWDGPWADDDPDANSTSGSGALLELGPQAIIKLASFVDEAEAAGTDEARLAAYDGLRQFISWLRFPLEHPEVY
jgi:hypothetical protein